MTNKSVITLVLGILITFMCEYAATTYADEYLPSDEFLEFVQQHLEHVPPHIAPGATGDVLTKAIEVGKPYREGDTASFVEVAYGYFYLRLQEWRMRPDGNFSLRDCKLLPHQATCAVLILTPEGRRANTDDIRETALPPSDPEAVRLSKRVQNLILLHLKEQAI